MVLYNSTLSASETMANATPDEMQTSMTEWIEWQNQANTKVKIEFGLPLQAVSNVGPAGLSESASLVSGYATADAESEDALLEILKTHPHLKRQGATIDVFEMLSMPGLNA